MPYTYAPLAKKLLPTIEETKKAVQMADSTKNWDPRALLQILSRLPQADVKLLGLMQTRKLAVQGFNWDIVASDPENAESVTIALKTKDRFVRSKMHHRIGILMGAVFFGNAGVRCRWEDAGGEWVAVTTPVSSLSLVVKDGVPVMIEDSPTMSTKELDPRSQYVITSYNPFEESIPDYTGGIFRTVMWLVIIKQFNWQDWARFNEIFVQPYRWATYSQSASEQEKAITRQAAEQIGSEMWAAVPDNVKLQFVEAVKTGSIAAYKDLLQAVDEALAILILGQTLTTNVGDNGSYAAAKVHDLVRSDYMWHDLQLVEQAVNEQYISEDFRLNHGANIALRPSFRFVTDETEDFEKNSRIVSELKSQGVQFKKSEVYTKIGFTAPESGDEIL